MAQPANVEAWLRGPVAGVPAVLQPAAHAIIQARDEVRSAMGDFPAALLWERPAGVASVGFHLQHLSGVLDRLLTYARDEPLTESQRLALAAEGEASAPGADSLTPASLVDAFDAQVERALAQLRATDEARVTDARGVGRARLPSTVLGLVFHAAEHTQRHLGQLLVTARVVRAAAEPR
jgi:uncharacterized damage-inducible protein DinB